MCVCVLSGLKDSQAAPSCFCSLLLQKLLETKSSPCSRWGGGVASSARRQEKMRTYSRHFHIKSMCEGCQTAFASLKNTLSLLLLPCFTIPTLLPSSPLFSAPAFFFFLGWGGSVRIHVTNTHSGQRQLWLVAPCLLPSFAFPSTPRFQRGTPEEFWHIWRHQQMRVWRVKVRVSVSS